ncbi:MAG: methyltransferase domain-containing protein [Kofleriaceae bacterium]|nr:methyltransferase domain-containing protein [Kofleriaceae bacterium]
MRWWILFALAACAGPAANRVPADPPKPIEIHAPAITAAAPVVDEPALVAKTHAWFDAMDRMDLAGFVEPLGPTFVLFEDQRFLGKDLLVKVFQGRLDQHAPVRSRTWSDEHTFISGGTAVFIGRAVETIPAFGDRPATTEDGYNTVVWVRGEAGHWQVAHWQWARGGIDAERQRWNVVFKQGTAFNKKPNQFLVDALGGRKAKSGTALDLMTGQGRNAIYLASLGYKTTGVDISDEGLRQAREAAAKQKLKVDFIDADVEKYDLGTAKWDIVTMLYAGSDAKLVERVKPSLAKGGLFICEYFHADSEVAKAGAMGWKSGELAALFKDGFTILKDEVVEDTADWAGQRKTKLVRFVAQKQ